MSDDTKGQLKKQIEYYFSDKNLKKDKFFHNKISSDKEGWVDIAFIMNCNKIKQLTSVQEDVIEAVNASDEVEYETGEYTIPSSNHTLNFLNIS